MTLALTVASECNRHCIYLKERVLNIFLFFFFLQKSEISEIPSASAGARDGSGSGSGRRVTGMLFYLNEESSFPFFFKFYSRK